MNHRITKSLFLVATVFTVACLDMSAPKGPAFISVLQLPSPSVVIGDVMRDSNGTPSPLTIVAFDSHGVPIASATAEFFITDSLHLVHISSTNQLFGDKIGLARIVGQIGDLQTTAVTVPVTFAPDNISFAGIADSLNAPLGADSASSLATLALGVLVKSAQDSASQGFIVRYVITHAPATSPTAKSPAVYLADDNGKITTADTSDASGLASPRLAVNPFFLADSAGFFAGTLKDSVIVEASAKYNGVLIKGSPLRFIVKLTSVF